MRSDGGHDESISARTFLGGSPMSVESVRAYDTWHEAIGAHDGSRDPLTLPWYRSAFTEIRDDLGGALLEVGCGRGEFAVWLAVAVPGLRITGIDFSGAAIRLARKSAVAAAQPVHFIVGDAQALPFPDNSFDWIVSCECLEHIPRPRAMATEMYRVLKPRGRFCLTTENYLNGMLLAWLRSWLSGKQFDSGSGVQPLEQFFLFFQVQKYLQDTGLVVDHTASSHYQWLLLPRVDPSRLCTREFKSGWARQAAKPFGRHFSFFGHKPGSTS